MKTISKTNKKTAYAKYANAFSAFAGKLSGEDWFIDSGALRRMNPGAAASAVRKANWHGNHSMERALQSRLQDCLIYSTWTCAGPWKPDHSAVQDISYDH